MSLRAGTARVSVIVPTYNQSRLLRTTLEHLLAQTYRNLEIIVVDDGSRDDTEAMIAGYAGRLEYIKQANQGVSAARNAGIRVASGTYLAFMDHDDLGSPTKYELLAGFLDTHHRYGLVYSAWQSISEDGSVVLRETRPNKQGHLLKELLLRSFFLLPGTVLLRRECLERVGPFDEAIPAAADTDLWVRLASAGYEFGYVDELLFQYRIVAGSMSTKILEHARDEISRLDKFFSNPDLTDDVRALEARAYAILHFETAARLYRAGELEQAKHYVRTAVSTCAPLAADGEWLLEWLAGVAMEVQTTDPFRLFDSIFHNLPQEATLLRTLRRRAVGRYHAAALFSAYQNRRPAGARRHILPAIAGDPRMLWNRGFLRVTLEALRASG